MSREVVVTSSGAAFEQRIEAGPHRFRSDEPASVGGADSGPGPYDLLLAALGSCTAMTIGLYARRKRWSLERVSVRLTHTREHAQDCADCEEKPVRIERIERRIAFWGNLDAEQRKQLIAIAEKCPVHRTLTGELEIRTTLADGGSGGDQ
jgi:putative redox protein